MAARYSSFLKAQETRRVVAAVVFLMATGDQSVGLFARQLRLFTVLVPEPRLAVSKRVTARALDWNLLGHFGVLVEVAVLLLVLG